MIFARKNLSRTYAFIVTINAYSMTTHVDYPVLLWMSKASLACRWVRINRTFIFLQSHNAAFVLSWTLRNNLLVAECCAMKHGCCRKTSAIGKCDVDVHVMHVSFCRFWSSFAVAELSTRSCSVSAHKAFNMQKRKIIFHFFNILRNSFSKGVWRTLKG